jgi:hypothetical protein
MLHISLSKVISWTAPVFVLISFALTEKSLDAENRRCGEAGEKQISLMVSEWQAS